MKLVRALAVVAALCLTAATASAQPRQAPTPPNVLGPTGTFSLGTQRFVWTDNARGSDPTASPAGPRQIVVQLWYPAQPGGIARPARYAMEEEIAPVIAEQALNEINRAGEIHDLRVPARREADPIDRRSFPLVLFSPGQGVPRALYTGYVMQLTSMGYAVAVIDSPGVGATIINERFVGPYSPWHRTPDGFRDRTEAERDAFHDVYRRQVGADQIFVLDRLTEMSARGSGSEYARHIDTARTAVIGHSDGFIAATCEDRRVKACINIEGIPGYAQRRSGLSHPLLIIRDGDDSPTMTSITATMRAPAYDLVVEGANHNSVTDLGTLGPQAGREAAERRLNIISAYSAAFLGQYIGGEEAPLLKPSSTTYREARLTWYGPVEAE